LGEHGEAEHGFFIYNATLRVPLIVKVPNTGYGTRDTGYGARKTDTSPALASLVAFPLFPASARAYPESQASFLPVSRVPYPVSRTPVATVDVAPTIAQLCGVPASETRSFQGRSLLRLFSATASNEDSAVYAESYYPRDSFGWHELRGLVNSHFKYIEAPRPELYDLARDPGERTNLAATHASVAASLREQLKDFESRYSGRGAAPAAKLDTETVERLRSLGYVAFATPAAGESGAPRADPKDKIESLRGILHASDLRRLGRYDEADEVLARLEASERDLYVVPFERGENFLAWSKPQAALAQFGKALTLNPSFDQAALGLGRAHFLLGEDGAAATSFQLALHFNPRNFLARVALAKVYWHENLPAQAEPELAEVVQEQPEMLAPRADYAVVLTKLGRYRDALPQFQRALAGNYREPVFFNYLGVTYAQLGEPDKAVHAYEQAVAMNPRYAAAFLNLALQWKTQNQPEKARLYYRKTCEISQELCRQYAGQFPQTQ
jgi:tetratricopeptide (TPR) repeat protein